MKTPIRPPVVPLIILLLTLAACMPLPAPAAVTPMPEPAPTVTSGPAFVRLPAIAAACDLTPVSQPTMPAEIPGYVQEDPATGLHMTGRPTLVDLATYRLQITGLVDRPLSLTYDELRCMPKVVQKCKLICPGFFQDEATWGGVPLAHVLDLAGVQKEAQYVLFVSADGYWTSLPLGDVRGAENFLAYEQTGEPLPVLHGFPVRAIFPSQPGGKWVKWLMEIRLLATEPRLGLESPIAQPTATE